MKKQELTSDGYNAHGVAMCECRPRGPVHAWEPGESCAPQRVIPKLEHREKAVEALARSRWVWWDASEEGEAKETVRRGIRDELRAADPHLKRMHFEQFAERLLEHEVKADATRAMNMAFNDAASDFEQYEAAIEAALDSIREGEDG